MGTYDAMAILENDGGKEMLSIFDFGNLLNKKVFNFMPFTMILFEWCQK